MSTINTRDEKRVCKICLDIKGYEIHIRRAEKTKVEKGEVLITNDVCKSVERLFTCISKEATTLGYQEIVKSLVKSKLYRRYKIGDDRLIGMMESGLIEEYRKEIGEISIKISTKVVGVYKMH